MIGWLPLPPLHKDDPSILPCETLSGEKCKAETDLRVQNLTQSGLKWGLAEGS